MRWWGAEGAERGRPIYRVARASNEHVTLHYSIVPGRPLTDYTMPYWPIRSCFSIVSGPAEIAHHVFMHYSDGEKAKELAFNPRSGIERAEREGTFFFKIRNRSIASPEDATIPADEEYNETTPCMAEHIFALQPGTPVVGVFCTLTNVSDKPVTEVSTEVRYAQSFNWSQFGVATDGAYTSVESPAEGRSNHFFAYSSGMNKGYAFSAGPGCRLRHQLETDMNRWAITLENATPGDLAPGASTTLSYTVRILDGPPETAQPGAFLTAEDISGLAFERIQPETFKTAPVDPGRRVTIGDQLADLSKAKVRGLNLRGSFPGILEDLETIRDWSGNLVILGLGNPDQTAQAIEHGHALGLEMLLQGRGSYRDGPPSFDAYYETERPPAQQPDAHGQDEDHYYWYAIEPSRNFKKNFDKPMAQATQKERVEYWGNCFRDKWAAVHENAAKHAPDTDVWFYSPMPSVAHTEALDYYDLFLKCFAPLGDSLTVFPFYYGIEYTQAEYMVRSWKDAGLPRVVFLPMSGFLTRPSQFFRVISAARRGGADGTCGFNFPVGDASPDYIWQWQSVLLAAHADFPTPELDALCLMEEPAELIEILARSNVTVTGEVNQVPEFVSALGPFLPGKIAATENSTHSRFTITIEQKLPKDSPLFQRIPANAADLDNKGFLLLEKEGLRVCGVTEEALDAARRLLGRFALLTPREAADS
ncbi:MAG: hypothetical protein R6V12_14155 [Candidatus Hydrogenedentota bacterium]